LVGFLRFIFSRTARATGPSLILSGIGGQNGSVIFALAEGGADVKVMRGLRAR
jgi:hypothetical protein